MREIFVNMILSKYNNVLQGKHFAVWGLAFKPKTNDMREAPAITVINKLLDAGATISAFDPKAMETAKNIWADKISYNDNYYDTLNDADGLLLLTEWNEFRNPDFKKIKQLMKTPIVFDARNQYDKSAILDNGIEYYSL